MKEIRRTDVFKQYMKNLKDATGKAHIDRRVNRLRQGNAGDCRPIGDGLSEMRIHYGPGYRVYFDDAGPEIIILLCAGDKSTQQADIERAKKLVKEEKKQDESK
ncbi:MAG: type II toxin-antitoxin system RelE/ParE family toxin [Treponema sp.]|jgi:putative addiction module killer protein|nr:type II toxin-antitoxin system RelE/ParE family toxin [Treponema sp.]